MDGRVYWLENVDDPFWRGSYEKLPKSLRDVYYHPDYARLYDKPNEHPALFVYTKGADVYYYPFLKAPVPYVDNYFDISTFYGYGGPLATTTDSAFIRLAYEAFYQEAIRRRVIAEVIKFHPLLNNDRLLTPIYQGEIIRMCSTVYVDLGIDEEQRWKNVYTHANRKNINKACRQNIGVSFDQTPETWQAFIRLYEETMRANKASEFYFFSPEYYRLLRERLAPHYVLASCRLDGNVLAVLLVLLGEEQAHCHLIGTDRQCLTTGAGNLLHHELIKWCGARGYRYLHIGGGRTNKEDDPLLSFKKNFSDQTASFFVGESILNKDVYQDACSRWQDQNPQKQAGGRLLKYRC